MRDGTDNFLMISQTNQKRVKKVSIRQLRKTINVFSMGRGISYWVVNTTLWSTGLNAKYLFFVFIDHS